jgi:apolipoprotein N-acyltransferase
MRVAVVHLVLVASGAALALAFPPYGIWPLAWFALIPPLWFATEENPRWLTTGGLLFGAAWGVVMLHWLYPLFESTGSGLTGCALWVIIGLFCAISFGLIGYVRQAWGVGVALLLAPFLWVGVEFFRSEIWPLKFSWLALPYSQHRNLGFLQSASAVGVYGLSLVMVAFAAAVVYAARRRSLAPFLGITAGVAAMHVTGVLLAPAPSEGTTAFAGVQLESPPDGDLRRGLEKLVAEHPDTTFLVLPEYCLDLTAPVRQREHVLAIVRNVAKDRWVLVGAKVPAGEGDFSSSIIALAPGGEEVFRQCKSVPVPLMDDGLPAGSRRVLETPHGRVGIGICYDMDFSFVANDLVNQGAEFLLYPSMEPAAWGDTERTQHPMVTPLRAIENRRWVMRVASSGVSQVVDPYGRVVVQLGIDAPGGRIAAKVGWRSERTPYLRAGWLIPYICMWGTPIIVAAAAVVQWRARRRAAAKVTLPGASAAVSLPDGEGPPDKKDTMASRDMT